MRILILLLIFTSCIKENDNKTNHSQKLTIDLYRNPSAKELKKKQWLKRFNKNKETLQEEIKLRSLNHNIDSLKFVIMKHLDKVQNVIMKIQHSYTFDTIHDGDIKYTDYKKVNWVYFLRGSN